jgi:hypothetical protein
MCSGPVHGVLISSYPAEGYGKLLALRFLLRMRDLYGPRFPQTTLCMSSIRCGNQSLVRKIQYILEYPHPPMLP